MITRNIKDTLYQADLEEVFVHILKGKTRLQLPAGYAVVKDKWEVLSTFLNKPDFRSNEMLLQEVFNATGLSPEWCYYDKNTFCFYLPMNTPVLRIREHDVQLYLEVINSYDGHKQRRINLALKINGFASFFTDFRVMDWENNVLKYIMYSSTLEVHIEDMLKHTFHPTVKPYALPNYMLHKAPREIYAREETSVVDFLNAHSAIITEWSSKSFLSARAYAINVYNYAINNY